MWEHYKKTFVRMQILIAMLTVGVYLVAGHGWRQAGALFLVMQIGAIYGARWGVRFRKMMRQRAERLPLEA